MHKFVQDKLRPLLQKVNKEDLGIWMHPKSIDTLVNIIFSLITAKSVISSDLGLHLNPYTKPESNVRTIERFWQKAIIPPFLSHIRYLSLFH